MLYTLFLSKRLKKLIPAQGFEANCMQSVRFKRLAYAAKDVIFLTVFKCKSGTFFVAGLVHKSFPKMGHNRIHDEILAV